MGRYDKTKARKNKIKTNLKKLGFKNIQITPTVAKKNCYENWEKYQPILDGELEIPVITGTNKVPKDIIRYCDRNSYTKLKNKTACFYYDDYKFINLWNNPAKHIENLKKFEMIIAPDFSIYTDFPVVLQILNHYRKHWLSAYYESLGIEIIPNIAWGDEFSYNFCFDGEPVNTTVAISTKGIMRNKEWQGEYGLWQTGYDEMIKRLKPQNIICYGKFCGDSRGYKVIEYQTQQEKRWSNNG